MTASDNLSQVAEVIEQVVGDFTSSHPATSGWLTRLTESASACRAGDSATAISKWQLAARIFSDSVPWNDQTTELDDNLRRKMRALRREDKSIPAAFGK